MRNREAGALLLAIALLWMPAALAEDSLASIEQALVTQWDKLNSLSVDLAIEADYPIAPPAPRTHVTGSGTAQYLKKGSIPLSRVEVAVNLTESVKLVGFMGLFDGKDAYVVTELLGAREAKKVPAGPDSGVVPPGGRALLDALHANFVVRAAPAATLNGRSVYVLDAVPKSMPPEVPVGRLRLYFDKSSGILLKALAADRQGVVLGSMTANNIRINEPINESRFAYVPSI